ncbi:porin family protein [Hymenobacter psychrotolerans]|uniref:Outer membrane protein beta-barrel domain-containing protein n=1 Tax=Hymenobacter psychrotolerans DSM 18569 TaxID=1121959 RepID=A0A1M6Z0G0_9BACT|nr:porin family protein [Hymenobacter psychrotolerans]SHL23842.1 Outer membrane protein beta-barrel domain-containing protein [Hymenobacter psychrotolerans DSM 18569]
MKKLILSLALVGFSTLGAQAQSARLGLKAGGSLTTFTGDAADGEDQKFGFHAGLFANLGINSTFSIQPELLYSQKGSKESFGNTDVVNRFSYIDVPVLLHINARGLFFEVGPQVGFLVAAKTELGNLSQDIKNDFNTVDFGYVAGLGYQLSNGPGIGLRYNGGFTKLPKAVPVGNTTYQADLRNSAIQLYVTYIVGK